MAALGLTISEEQLSGFNVGDIVQLQDGRRYKLIKKTTTACAVIPYTVIERLKDWWRDHIHDSSKGNDNITRRIKNA